MSTSSSTLDSKLLEANEEPSAAPHGDRHSIRSLTSQRDERSVSGRHVVHFREVAHRVLRLNWQRRNREGATTLNRGGSQFGHSTVAPPNVDELAQQRTPISVKQLRGSRPALVAVGALLSYTTFGVLIFHFSSMRLTWVSAFYFAITVSTTVGYGDINPVVARPNNTDNYHDGSYHPTNALLLMTSFYILGGVCVIGHSLGLLMQAVLEGGANISLGQRYSLRLSFLCVSLKIAEGASTWCSGRAGLWWLLPLLLTDHEWKG